MTQIDTDDPTSVYRYYDASDVLLYVGVTSRATSRNLEHYAKAEWWPFVVRQDVEHCPDRTSALAQEKALIQRHHPPFNNQHNPSHGEMRSIYLAFASDLPRADLNLRELFEITGGWLQLIVAKDGARRLSFRTWPNDQRLAAVLTFKGSTPIYADNGVVLGWASHLRQRGATATFRGELAKGRTNAEPLAAVARISCTDMKLSSFELRIKSVRVEL